MDTLSWTEAEPARFAHEMSAVPEVAPDLDWDPMGSRWLGPAPVWPFERSQPAGLDQFLGGRRFTIEVRYSQAFPMVPPRVMPVEPFPDLNLRTVHAWHLNGDGSLCLFRSAADWDGSGSATDVIVKASAWFLEYLLMERSKVEEMTEAGIVTDGSRDGLLVGPGEAAS